MTNEQREEMDWLEQRAEKNAAPLTADALMDAYRDLSEEERRGFEKLFDAIYRSKPVEKLAP